MFCTVIGDSTDFNNNVVLYKKNAENSISYVAFLSLKFIGPVSDVFTISSHVIT